jgi:hypothetical protein
LAARREPINGENTSLIEHSASGLNYSREPNEMLLIDFLALEQFGVVTEIAQEPVQLPQGFLGAIEPSRNLARGELLRFEDRETKNEKGFLRIPTIVGPVDSNQENAFERIADTVRF